MSDRYSAFSVAEGGKLSTDLGFLARSVVVDNLTASWLDMRGSAGRFVPPFTYGATFHLGAGVQIAQASFATPPGIIAGAQGGGTAQLTFTSALLAPSNGTPVQTPNPQVVCPIVRFTDPTGQVTQTGNTLTLPGPSGLNGGSIVITYNVPSGANSLIVDGTISWNDLFPGVSQGSITVTGTTTGTVYLATTVGKPGLPVECIVSPVADPQVTVTITQNGSGSGVTFSGLEVVACYGTTTVAVQGSGTGNPVAGNITQVGGVNTLIGPSPSSTLGQPTVPVTAWPPPNGTVFCYNVSGTVNSTTSLTPIGQSTNIRPILLGIYLSIHAPTVQALDFNGTISGTQVWNLRTDGGTGGLNYAFIDFRPGMALSLGDGLKITGETANNADLRGTIVAMQGSS